VVHQRRVDAVELLGLWRESFTEVTLVTDLGDQELREADSLASGGEKNESVGGYKKSGHIIPLPIEHDSQKLIVGLPCVCVRQTLGASLLTF
jgi:hypothetical protein